MFTTKCFSHPSKTHVSTQLIAQATRAIAGYLPNTKNGETLLVDNNNYNNLGSGDNSSDSPFEPAFQYLQEPNLLVSSTPSNSIPDIDPAIFDPPVVEMSAPTFSFPSPIATATILPVLEGRNNTYPVEPCTQTVPMTTREAIAYKRKLRNRESAARSNLKRSRKIAALKKANAEARREEQVLVDKLKKLEEMNTSLRRQVDASNQSTPTAQVT